MIQNSKGTGGFGPTGPRNRITPEACERHDATDGADMATTPEAQR